MPRVWKQLISRHTTCLRVFEVENNRDVRNNPASHIYHNANLNQPVLKICTFSIGSSKLSLSSSLSLIFDPLKPIPPHLSKLARCFTCQSQRPVCVLPNAANFVVVLHMAETLTDISLLTTEVNLFGKYEVGRLLGCGAFAKVYYGRNLRTGQSVAIKAVSKKKVIKEGFVAQVKREISIMRRLRHPNVVKLLEVLATKTKIYFVMEFAKGGELFAKLAKGRFTEDLSRRYFQQLITAIGYCHARGVFHRDLKLENLLLDDNWNLKITDFGLSAVKDQIRSDGLLHTLCGTPAYVAPEILAKKGYDGAKVDVWSCGIILYVLIAGYLPFNHSNLMIMYKKIYKGEFRFPKWTSPDLKRFLCRLLDTNPDTRITVDEIIKDPWFKKNYKATNSVFEDYDGKENNNQVLNQNCLNAFDIISFSPGFDLSSMFSQDDCSVRTDRFVSSSPPERIVKRVEEVVVNIEGLSVTKKKNWGLKLQGQNGEFALRIDVYRLTEELVVVETKEVYREPPELGQEIWKDKLRPRLSDLICPPGPSVLGE